MAFLVTFLEGVITFISPCLLPLLPVYLAYFAGGSQAEGQGAMRGTLACALCFVLGFGLVFLAMGAFAGVLGTLLMSHQRLLDLLCGIFVLVLGLAYLGLLPLPQLDTGGAGRWTKAPRNPLSAFVFGVVFALAWTPCVGTFLASALSLAASSANALVGILLLLCYTLGLGIPFVISALLIDQLGSALAWVKSHYAMVNRTSGILLVLVGALMASGLLGSFLRLLS
ncbi:MAG: sulfite exporter TauE/SafE family protein [Atopobiaceae bacterium]|nr:sulfite exporter TauE/SafE family protein [Atopobiaceae bacterium]